MKPQFNLYVLLIRYCCESKSEESDVEVHYADDYTFRLSTEGKFTYDEADKFCTDLGYTLPVPKSADENNLLHDIVECLDTELWLNFIKYNDLETSRPQHIQDDLEEMVSFDSLNL